jgi:aldehyde dehydrogenase (NAD+)
MPIDHSAAIAMLPEARMFIGGEWERGSTETIPLVDPSTGAEVASVPMAGPDQVDRAVAAAHAAAAPWRKWRPSKRRDTLLKLADLLVGHSDLLATVGGVEQGLTRTVPYARFCAEWFRYYAGWADKMTGRTNPSYPIDALSYSLLEPYGVVAVITPFNVSLGALGMKVAPALAAGNCVVIKPPEQTPLQTVLFAQLCEAADIPPGVVNVVTGGPSAGAALVGHPLVRKVTFTGSVGTAKAILRTAAENITPVITELGGKSANIAFADGDWKAAATLSAVNSCINNSGQGCMFPTRLLVESSIHDQVVAHVLDQLTAVSVGDPLDRATQLGPLISSDAADRVMSVVREAATSARLVLGGERLGGDLADGFFIGPTVFDSVDPASQLAQQEVFGPVLAISVFSDEREAVDIANRTPTGLAAYVYTDDLRRAHRLARELEAGTVGINGMTTVPASFPFGGYKQSGYGREGGEEGLLEFVQTKNVYVPLG